jgi:hypothetical protein
MELTGIKFNYSQDTGAVNALSIRQNFTTGIAVPEWVKGKTLPKSSPVAYSITAVAGKIITIQASFATDPRVPRSTMISSSKGE